MKIMKNIHFFFLPLLCSALSMQAATLVVDNTSPSPGQYTTIAAAMTAAASGDTLLIQGTQTNYGNVFVTKSITLRGAGWSPIYKQTPYPTTLGIIYLASGVHDIKIEGIDLDILDQQANYGQYNITVQFCKIRGVIYYWTGCHDWLIRNNYFSSLENANIDAGGQSAYNLTVQHNIFQGYIYRFTSATNVFIDHNLFISPPSNVFAFAGGTNGLFCANNIFYTTFATSSSTITNCTFANNSSLEE